MTAPTSPHSSDCVWLHDGAAGNRRQVAALIEALGLPAREWVLTPRAPWRWLAPRTLLGASAAFGDDFSVLYRSPPALVIGCGRQAALATRLLRAAGSRSVQILNPRIDPAHWDVVIAPHHDGLAAANVLTLCGSLNPINATWLAQAQEEAPTFAALPAPHTAVLLGGQTSAVRFDLEAFETLAIKLDALLSEQGGSLLVLGSRRTDPRIAAQARQRWASTPGLRWFDASDGPNPYAAVMGWAQRFVVSPDSVNMISEACATSVPVFVAEPDRATGRVRSFIDDLMTRGRIRAQDTQLSTFAVEPLQETARLAAQLRKRLSL